MIMLMVAFGLPWLFMIIVPFVQMSNAKVVPYSEDDKMPAGAEGFPDYSSASVRLGNGDGADIYIAEGCVYCHTQMIRPTYAGPDRWRKGWSGREDEGLARETVPQDYTGQPYALLGYQRMGPDLSNVGYRVTSREEMHRHLIDPKSFNLESGMPAYKHLYVPSPKADGSYAPTGRAEALVDYLLSRKMDAKIPAAAK